MSGVDSTLEVDNKILKDVLVSDINKSKGLFCTNQAKKLKIVIIIS